MTKGDGVESAQGLRDSEGYAGFAIRNQLLALGRAGGRSVFYRGSSGNTPTVFEASDTLAVDELAEFAYLIASEEVSRPTSHPAAAGPWLTSAPDGMEIVQWVPINVRLDDGFYFAENETLGVYGVGPSAQDAIEDFRTTLGEVYANFRETPTDEMSPEASRYLASLERYVRAL